MFCFFLKENRRQNGSGVEIKRAYEKNWNLHRKKHVLNYYSFKFRPVQWLSPITKIIPFRFLSWLKSQHSAMCLDLKSNGYQSHQQVFHQLFFCSSHLEICKLLFLILCLLIQKLTSLKSSICKGHFQKWNFHGTTISPPYFSLLLRLSYPPPSVSRRLFGSGIAVALLKENFPFRSVVSLQM